MGKIDTDGRAIANPIEPSAVIRRIEKIDRAYSPGYKKGARDGA
jgi:hypothetical protein